MRILILGGDGYLGWPTAMFLSSCGYRVTIVDNYFRRYLCLKQNVSPLFPVPDLLERTNLWRYHSGFNIDLFIGDLRDWEFISYVFKLVEPQTIIHYAEQPSAPFSMLDRRAAHLTLLNNLEVTFNVIFATKKYSPQSHIIKIGTMGEYGTPNIDIEEGWIEIEHNSRRHKFLFPRQASSLYHTTKIMDTDLLWFYCRMWGLRATDLMQGPVYGIISNETKEYNELLPFFNYDELFGTVLNRFVVQAIIDHPLTIYGQGNQRRGYINLIDTLNCVKLSIENPAALGELKIYNQFTEIFSVKELAQKVKKACHTIGINVKMRNINNPRIEQDEHYYNPKNNNLLGLGLSPHLLTESVLIEMIEKAIEFKKHINKNIIFKGVKWDK